MALNKRVRSSAQLPEVLFWSDKETATWSALCVFTTVYVPILTDYIGGGGVRGIPVQRSCLFLIFRSLFSLQIISRSLFWEHSLFTVLSNNYSLFTVLR